MSEGVLAAVLAADDETQPRPIVDVREDITRAVIATLTEPRFIHLCELFELRGQSGFVYLLAPKPAGLLGEFPWLQDRTVRHSPGRAIMNGKVRSVTILGGIFRLDEVIRAVIVPSILDIGAGGWLALPIFVGLDHVFGRRTKSGTVLSPMRAADYQPFPRPIGDICEVVITKLITPDRMIHVVFGRILPLVFPKGLGQPALIQLLALKELWLKGIDVLGTVLLLGVIARTAVRCHLANRN
ncbi:hypothetical protein PG988_015047 [Apiospora saccharicola]